MEFNRELIMKPKTVVHCKTQEEADALCAVFTGCRESWFCNASDSYPGIGYDVLESMWCDIPWLIEHGHTILSFSEVLVQDKDFRIGDVVCSTLFGDGVVTEIHHEEVYPITVSSGRCNYPFSAKGCYSKADLHPSLFHGTYEEVFGSVKDKLPIRKKIKYLNVFLDINGKPVAYLHESEEEAREAIWYGPKAIYPVIAQEVTVG